MSSAVRTLSALPTATDNSPMVEMMSRLGFPVRLNLSVYFETIAVNKSRVSIGSLSRAMGTSGSQ